MRDQWAATSYVPGGKPSEWVARRYKAGKRIECGHRHRLQKKAAECADKLNWAKPHRDKNCMRNLSTGPEQRGTFTVCGEPAIYVWVYILPHYAGPSEIWYYCGQEGHRQPGSRKIPPLPKEEQ